MDVKGLNSVSGLDENFAPFAPRCRIHDYHTSVLSSDTWRTLHIAWFFKKIKQCWT